MSFPPATEMVQFAGFASSSYGFTEGYPKRGGLPHSDIPGSTVARTSPGLFAACHVLHRLSVPRHPPDALTSRSPTPSPKRTFLEGYRPSACSSPKGLKQRSGRPPKSAGTDAQASLPPGLAPRQAFAPPMLAHRRSHTHARIRPRRTWPDPLHGFTTRFTMSKERMAENGCQMSDGHAPAMARPRPSSKGRYAGHARRTPSDIGLATSVFRTPFRCQDLAVRTQKACRSRANGGPGPT